MKTKPLLQKFYFLFIAAFFVGETFAQNPVTKVFEEWHDTAASQDSYQISAVRSKGIGGVTYYYTCGSTFNAGHYDMFIRKTDVSGNLLWQHTWNGGSGDAVCGDVQISNNGDVYLTGSYYANSTDSFNAVTLKYNNAGSFRWSKSYNGASSGNDGTVAMLLNLTNGTVWSVGSTWAGSTNKYDFFFTKIDSAGTQLVASSWNYLNYNDGASKVYLRSGSLFIAGGASSAATTYKYAILKVNNSNGAVISNTVSGGTAFGIDKLTDLVQNPVTGDVYVTGGVLNISTLYDYKTIALDSQLNVLWTATYDAGNNLNDLATGLYLDATGNVIVTGSTETADTTKDYTTIKYNSSGTQIWVANYNDTAINGNDSASAIVADPNDSDKIYVTGYSYNGSTKDYYTIRYDGGGNLIWGIGYNSFENGNDRAYAIAQDSIGDLVVTGQNKINDSTYYYTTVKYIETAVTLAEDTIASISNSFVYTENRGQLLNTNGDSIPEVKYYTIHGNPNVYFTDTAASYVFAKLDTSSAHVDSLARVDMKYKNANAGIKIRSMNVRREYENFYLGHIPDGRCHVQNFDNLVSFNVWNNVDVIYGSNLSGMKYYFICKPGGGGGSFANIDLQYNGADSLKVDGTGQLIIYTRIGNIIQPKAAAWEIDGSGNFYGLSWQPTYAIANGNEVTFSSIGSYNTAHSLVIAIDCGYGSPSALSTDNLLWSTFEGGSLDDRFNSVSVSTTNWIFAGGTSTSTDFPFTTGGSQPTNAGNTDGVIQQFYIGIPQWATYLGGTGNDYIYSVSASGSSNSVYLAGKTYSPNFPTAGIAGSFTNYSGGTSSDAIIGKLNGGGGLVWSTCYGSTGNEIAWCIKAQNQTTPFYVCGQGLSNNALLTTETGASNLTQGASFIVKYDPTSFQRIWATRFGAASARKMDLTGNPSNFLVITGEVIGSGLPSATNSFGGGTYDAYVAAFNSSDLLNWSTYYGGNNNETCLGVAANSMGDIIIGGTTNGSNTPTPNPGGAYQITSFCGGVYDAFLASFNSSGTNIYGTYLGGSSDEFTLDICTDQYDNIYLVGFTGSTNFPMPVSNPPNYYTHSVMAGYDQIIYEFDKYYSPVWGTYFGGHGWDEAESVCVYEGATNSYLYTAGFTTSTYTAPIDPYPILRTSSGDFSAAYQHQYLNNSGSNYPIDPDGFINAFDLTSNPTGISNSSDNIIGINIYPNPSTGNVFLDFQHAENENVKISVYDVFGQIIYQESERSKSGKYHRALDLSFASNGVYFVTLELPNQILTQKIVLDN